MDADVIFILFQMLKYFIKTISYKQIGHNLNKGSLGVQSSHDCYLLFTSGIFQTSYVEQIRKN